MTEGERFLDLIAWFIGYAETYTVPILTVIGSDRVVELDPGGPLDPEDEERFVEASVQAQGLAVPGVVLFCRHPDGGWRVIQAGDETFTFFRLDPQAAALELEPRPDFWTALPVPPGRASSSLN